MAKTIIILSVVFVITFLATKANADISCYRCNSTNPNQDYCMDEFHAETDILQSCNQPIDKDKKTVCMKTKRSYNGKMYYARDCAYILKTDKAGDCRKIIKPAFGKFEFCEYCDKDKCNGASQIVPLSMAASLVLTGVAAIWRSFGIRNYF